MYEKSNYLWLNWVFFIWIDDMVDSYYGQVMDELEFDLSNCDTWVIAHLPPTRFVCPPIHLHPKIWLPTQKNYLSLQSSALPIILAQLG